MKVFVDANVFLDILEYREGWRSSLALIQLVREKRVEGYISALTIAIIYFLRARVSAEGDARESARRAVHKFNVIDLTQDVIARAFKEDKIEDLEDALQFHSAKTSTKIFITRNKRHFKAVEDEMEFLTPEEFLKKYRP